MSKYNKGDLVNIMGRITAVDTNDKYTPYEVTAVRERAWFAEKDIELAHPWHKCTDELPDRTVSQLLACYRDGYGWYYIVTDYNSETKLFNAMFNKECAITVDYWRYIAPPTGEE